MALAAFGWNASAALMPNLGNLASSVAGSLATSLDNLVMKFVPESFISAVFKTRVEGTKDLFFADFVPLFYPELNVKSVLSGSMDTEPILGHAAVHIVNWEGYTHFGFLTVRLDYTDDAKWEEWGDQFIPIIDASLSSILGGDKILDMWINANVEMEELSTMGLSGVASLCSTAMGIVGEEGVLPVDLKKNPASESEGDISGLPAGLHTTMVLVADNNAMDSLLSPTEGEEPWVWALDLMHSQEQFAHFPDGDLPTNKYPGYFRVALSAVATKLWPLLKIRGVYGDALWQPHVRVWNGIRAEPGADKHEEL